MRTYEYPFFADWFAISLRWLVLVGVAYSLVLANTFNYALALAVLAGILWNFFCTLLAIFNRRIAGHRVFNVLFDFIGTTLLFFFSRGFYGPLSWVGLLNLFSAGIYYGWIGSLILAVLISALQIFGSLYVLDVYIAGQHIALLAGFNLLSGLLFGLLSQNLYLHLRDHFNTLRTRRWQTEEKLRAAERHRLREMCQRLASFKPVSSSPDAAQAVLDYSEHVCTGCGGPELPLVSAMLRYAGESLVIYAARGVPAGDIQIVFPAAEGALMQAVHGGEMVHLERPYDDPELGKLLALRDCQSALVLPLSSGVDSAGLLLFAHVNGDYFKGERRDMLEIISSHTVFTQR